MAFEIICAITNTAKTRFAQMLETGKSFQVKYFTVGDKGHDPLNPAVALTPDPSLTSCPSNLFPGTSPGEAIDSIAFVGAYCPEFTCIMEPGEGTGFVSNICLIAEIVYNGTDPVDEVGQTFLFCIGNMPLKIKTDVDTFTFKIEIQF
jgi:hypothetical protein